MKYIYFYETEIGSICLGEEDSFITNLYFKNEWDLEESQVKETPLIKEAKKQLDEYLTGNRKEFDLPLKAIGTEFQQKVWDALQEIPYGETRYYGEIAEMIGNPKAPRAVGLANNRNPISIFIPCHRVIGKNGKLVGYGGGLHIKELLLNLEKGKTE
ncbi:MAG: methylated-DNA--[protein]-cysteine S-methyltransferase [Tissierellaceae bacterium]|nr:methylated-DNA--[protein]-cysteine S-methyltransferase [Tissierellaceae bacterium]